MQTHWRTWWRARVSYSDNANVALAEWLACHVLHWTKRSHTGNIPPRNVLIKWRSACKHQSHIGYIFNRQIGHIRKASSKLKPARHEVSHYVLSGRSNNKKVLTFLPWIQREPLYPHSNQGTMRQGFQGLAGHCCRTCFMCIDKWVVSMANSWAPNNDSLAY